MESRASQDQGDFFFKNLQPCSIKCPFSASCVDFSLFIRCIFLWGYSTLAKEFSAAARIMQSSSKELSTMLADRV